MNNTEGVGVMFDSQSRIEFVPYEGQLFIYTVGQSSFIVWCFGYSPKRIQKLLCDLQDAQAATAETRGQTQVYLASLRSSVSWYS